MLAELEAEGRAMVAEAGVTDITIRRIAAMRYAGQGYQVEAEVTALDRDSLRAAFEQEYRRLYGRIEAGLPVETVGWRVIVAGPTPKLELARARDGAARSLKGTRQAWFGTGFVQAEVHDRTALRPGDRLAGPALVEERESTLVLPPASRATVDAALNLVVEFG
nr:hypothetical protein [Falsiroseomonas tokyonensis]